MSNEYIIEIIEESAPTIEIVNTEKITISDLPDYYPVSQISGLADYLNSFIVNGSGLSKVYYSNSGIIISVTGSIGGGGEGLSTEDVQDIIGTYISGYSGVNISYNDTTGYTNIYLSGLTASYISDFNSSVSGASPVKSISGGYGVNVSGNNGNYTLSSNLVFIPESNTLLATVFNKTASTIPKFRAVYISGGQGDLPTIAYASASGELSSSKTFGITQNDISSMSSGTVVVYGNINSLNTDQFNPTAPAGDVNGRVLYLSPSGSGLLTLSKPYAPYHMVSVGTIVRTHQNEGIVNVRVQNGFEMEVLHNVVSTGVISGQFLKYDGNLWRNTGILSTDIGDFSSAVSGISPNITISGISGISVDKNGNNYVVYTTGTFGLTSSQIQSLLNSGVSIYVTGNSSGNFSSLNINNIPVSTSGHLHITSNIVDFNSTVSGLLPSISGSGYVITNLNNNSYIIGITGLQPSGNYSISGHNHVTSDITNFNSSVSGLLIPYALLNSGNFNNLFINGTPVSLSGHTHISSQIIDFDSSVSGLLPVKSITGSGYVVITSGTGNYNIYVTGLQPSGNYSISGHTHITSNITDFNTATSGLLVPYALLSSGNFTTLFVTGVPVSVSGHSHTISIGSGNNIGVLNFTTNEVLNVVGSGNTSIFYNDSSNTLTIGSIGGGGGSSNVSISGSGNGRIFTSDGSSINLIGNSGLTYVSGVLTVFDKVKIDQKNNTINSRNITNIVNSSKLYMWNNFR